MFSLIQFSKLMLEGRQNSFLKKYVQDEMLIGDQF